MIRDALHRIALPVAIALTFSLAACESTSGTGVSQPGPPPVNDAPISPPGSGISADAPPPSVDPAPMPPPSSSVSPPMAGTMHCDDSKGQSAVGQTATQAVVDKVIAETGSRDARVIKPGQAVTMDYREDRVNINVDANNLIGSVKCG
ncbi:MAG: I78 family peptidase inhibitor [Luteimonas sp.]